MFTGLIEATAQVQSFERGRLTIERPASFDDILIGSSIDVSGVCLTIAALDERSMAFDVVGTTMRKSTLGLLRKGDRVNLERAMIATHRFEGHIVQGHTEGFGEVVSLKGGLLMVRCLPVLPPSIVSHGSIAVDGVSLTIAEVQGDTFTVALIPTTIEHTTLGSLKKGDRVNLETDFLVRAMLEKS